MSCTKFILLAVLALFSSISQALVYQVIETEKGEIRISELEAKLLVLAVENIEYQKNFENAALAREFQGDISHAGVEYSYSAESGILRLKGHSSGFKSELPLGDIIRAVISNDDNTKANKCPVCIGLGIVAVGQAICSLTESASAGYCDRVCECGVESYSTTCVLGMRSTECNCFPCPDPIFPIPQLPTGPGWVGPFYSGTTFINYGSAYQIGNPYDPD